MNLFKKRKSKEEILREKYIKDLNTQTTYTNGVRINEDATGQLKRLREDIVQESSCRARVQSSTPRPVDFGNDMAAWMEAVRFEARKLILANVSPLRRVA